MKMLLAFFVFRLLAISGQPQTTNCSPIRLPGSNFEDQVDNPLKIKYGFGGDEIVMRSLNGLRFAFDGDNTIEFSGIKADLSAVHLKTPSEHVLGNTRYPLELQFLHQGPASEYIFMSILYQEGPPDPVLEDLFYYIKRAPEETQFPVTLGVQLDRFTREMGTPVVGSRGGNSIELEHVRFLAYNGSSTQLPSDSCTGDVYWIVHRDTKTVSAEQLELIRTWAKRDTGRDLQERNGRPVVGGSYSDSDEGDVVMANAVAWDNPSALANPSGGDPNDPDNKSKGSGKCTKPPYGAGFFDTKCHGPGWWVALTLIGISIIPLTFFCLKLCCKGCENCRANIEARRNLGAQMQQSPVRQSVPAGPRPSQPPPRGTSIAFERPAGSPAAREPLGGAPGGVNVPGLGGKIMCNEDGYCWVERADGTKQEQEKSSLLGGKIKWGRAAV